MYYTSARYLSIELSVYLSRCLSITRDAEFWPPSIHIHVVKQRYVPIELPCHFHPNHFCTRTNSVLLHFGVLVNPAAASCAFFVDDRLVTLVARHLIGQLGTVIVSLLTNDLAFKHVYPLHINHFPFAALVFRAAVCSLKVSGSLYDALFSRPRPPKNPAPGRRPRAGAFRTAC